MKKSHGFTLIELMVTIAIIAILAMIAIPNYADFLRSSELSSRTSTLVAGINAARGEAMKRGRYAMTVPADGANWSSGVLVFVDLNGNKNFDDTTDMIILRNSEALQSFLNVSGSGTAKDENPYILFDAQGYTRTNTGSFLGSKLVISRNDVSTTRQASQTRVIIIERTGRLRTCTPKSDNDKTCDLKT